MDHCAYCGGMLTHTAECLTQQPTYCPNAGEVEVHGECCGPLPRERGRVAVPILVSRAHVAPKASKRLGYAYVAICRNCPGAIVILNEDAANRGPWVHRADRERDCPPRQLDARRVG